MRERRFEGTELGSLSQAKRKSFISSDLAQCAEADSLIVLQNITSTPVQKFRRLRRLSHDDMCTEIPQPPAFGLFDLGINRDINRRSPLFQKLQADVKVEVNAASDGRASSLTASASFKQLKRKSRFMELGNLQFDRLHFLKLRVLHVMLSASLPLNTAKA